MFKKSKSQPPEQLSVKVRSPEPKTEAEELNGIYGKGDSSAYILKYAVPVLAATLDAPNPTYRSMVGRVGSLNRSATRYTSESDRIEYEVFIDRSTEPDDRGKTIGRVTLQIVIRYYHQLDDSEIITEWPLLEETGAAADLVTAAAGHHVPSEYMEGEINLDDPALNAELMQAQLDAMSELDKDDEESLPSVLFTSEVERYLEKKLRLVTGFRPSLSISAGYQTDESSFNFEIQDGYRTSLLGNTLEELDIMTQLNKEAFVTVDAEVMKEFLEALEVVGVLARKGKTSKSKKKKPTTLLSSYN